MLSDLPDDAVGGDEDTAYRVRQRMPADESSGSGTTAPGAGLPSFGVRELATAFNTAKRTVHLDPLKKA